MKSKFVAFLLFCLVLTCCYPLFYKDGYIRMKVSADKPNALLVLTYKNPDGNLIKLTGITEANGKTGFRLKTSGINEVNLTAVDDVKIESVVIKGRKTEKFFHPESLKFKISDVGGAKYFDIKLFVLIVCVLSGIFFIAPFLKKQNCKKLNIRC